MKGDGEDLEADNMPVGPDIKFLLCRFRCNDDINSFFSTQGCYATSAPNLCLTILMILHQ